MTDLDQLEAPRNSPASDASVLGVFLFIAACIMGGLFGHAVRGVTLDGERGPYNWTMFATFVCAGFVVLGVCLAVAVLLYHTTE